MKCTTHNGDIYMVCFKCDKLIRWINRTEDGICKKCRDKKELTSESANGRLSGLGPDNGGSNPPSLTKCKEEVI